MINLILRIAINAVALLVADWLFKENLTLTDDFLGLIFVAAIFGLVNAFIRPIIKLLTCPLNVLTLGLFTLVINAFMLLLTEWLSGGRLETSGFIWAFLAAIVISIVSTVLSWFLPDKGD
jgi:putative membrane protein